MRCLILLTATLTATLTVACASDPSPSTTAEPSESAGGGDPEQPGACITAGCSGIVCAEPGKDVFTTCEYRAEYACYQKATCEKQPDGTCGWTQTAELTSCLASPPPM